jgi:hypothetical protein
MAEATQFDHDRLSHLLADHLLRVPEFQRSYPWDESNVDEFLIDLESARRRGTPYFMGTVVFANSPEDGQRQQIVDGQQRLATHDGTGSGVRVGRGAGGTARQAPGESGPSCLATVGRARLSVAVVTTLADVLPGRRVTS